MTRTPRTCANGTWTTARKFSFIRSALRRAFVRWPPNYAARRDARRAYCGTRKNQKWEFQCAKCGGWFIQRNTQIDHKKECGTLRRYEDLPGFAARLFCEKDGLQVLCKPCHKAKTQLSRARVTKGTA